MNAREFIFTREFLDLCRLVNEVMEPKLDPMEIRAKILERQQRIAECENTSPHKRKNEPYFGGFPNDYYGHDSARCPLCKGGGT